MEAQRWTVAEALQAAFTALQPHSETARLDSQVLLAHLLQVPRTWVLIHPEARLTPSQAEALRAAQARLQRGEPLPYVLGAWEFYGRAFAVTPDVLIPRPETELLVEVALNWLDSRPQRVRAVDAGTGSGCIAVTLAAERPSLRVLAADISAAALKVARQNVQRHALSGRVRLLRADLLAPLAPRSCDLICANLPYIPTQRLRGLKVYGREPSLALDGGADGLRLIRRLLAQAQTRLAPGGLLLLEIEATQGEAALRLARRAFPAARITLRQDLSGRPRLVRVERPR